MEATIWALVVLLVAMLVRMAGGKPSTIGLVVLPLVAPVTPYLYARFFMAAGDHMGMGFVLVFGMPLAFIAGMVLSVAIYTWRNGRRTST